MQQLDLEISLSLSDHFHSFENIFLHGSLLFVCCEENSNVLCLHTRYNSATTEHMKCNAKGRYRQSLLPFDLMANMKTLTSITSGPSMDLALYNSFF